MQLAFPVPPQHNGHATSIRRNSGRLQQRAVGALPDLSHLSVPKAPQSVACPEGRQVKQRRTAKPRRQGTDVRHCKRFYVAFFGESIKDRNAPKASRWVADGGHQLTAVRAGLHRRILLESDARAPRIPAFQIKRPQPWSCAVLVARHVEHCAVADRRGISDICIALREALCVPAVWVYAPQIHLLRRRRPMNKIDPPAIRRPSWKMVVNSRPVPEYPPSIRASAVRHEHGVAITEGMID